jgi:N-acetylneuraminic acid mutarotase
MPSAVHRILAAVAATILLSALTISAQGRGRWVTNKFAPLPEPAEEYTSVVANGKLHLIGGNAVNVGGRSVHPARVLEYDLATDRWTSKKSVPFGADHMAAAEHQGKIYVFGGQGPQQPNDGGPSGFPLDKTWEYDPAADSWKSLAPMPSKRTAAAAVGVGGKIYVIGGVTFSPGTEGKPLGGNNPGLTVNANEAYDPATNRWEERRPMPTPRNHPAAGVVGGKVYVIGGRLAAVNIGGLLSSNTDVVEEYDPATNTWRPMTKMPTARSGHGWTTYEGRIYVAGGEHRDSHQDTIFRDVEAFDPATDEWVRMSPMPTARHGVNLAAFGNRLYVIGGHLAFAATGGHALDTSLNEVFEFSQK